MKWKCNLWKFQSWIATYSKSEIYLRNPFDQHIVRDVFQLNIGSQEIRMNGSFDFVQRIDFDNNLIHFYSASFNKVLHEESLRRSLN